MLVSATLTIEVSTIAMIRPSIVVSVIMMTGGSARAARSGRAGDAEPRGFSAAARIGNGPSKGKRTAARRRAMQRGQRGSTR